MFPHRNLMMRASRLFGAGLIEHNLVKLEDLEGPNDKFLAAATSGTGRPPHLLHTLLYDTQTLKEDTLITLQVEELGLGLVDLRTIDIAEEVRSTYDADVAWATASVPFDREEDVSFVASTYYLSSVVRDYWASRLKGNILWFATSLDSLVETIQSMEKKS